MKEDKFYTPNLEEFHIGFEFEVTHVAHNDKKQWSKYILSKEDYVWILKIWDSLKEYNDIRVKHLDMGDIKELGFKFSEFLFDETLEFTNKDNIYLHVKDNNIRIYNLKSKQASTCVIFNGTIKNKSELKVLLNQLGIS